MGSFRAGPKLPSAINATLNFESSRITAFGHHGEKDTKRLRFARMHPKLHGLFARTGSHGRELSECTSVEH